MLKRKQELSFPRLLNVRDLGGHPTRDNGETRWKSFVRADDLGQLTPEGLQAVVEYGVRTVIDLRWPAETEVKPHPFRRSRDGARYVHISLLGRSAGAWQERCPSSTVTKETWGCAALDRAQEGIRDAMRTIAAAPEGGILFHCYAGKDRTGVVAALLLALADVLPEVIADDYAASTGYLWDGWLAAAPEHEHEALREHMRCPQEHIHNLLEHLDREYRGPAAYLERIGLSEPEIARIRERVRH